MRNNFQCIVASHGRPDRIAAGYIDYVAFFYGDGFAAGVIIIGGRSVLVEIRSYLECFVVRSVVKSYGVFSLFHGKKIARGFLIEGGSKSSVSCGKLLQSGIGVALRNGSRRYKRRRQRCRKNRRPYARPARRRSSALGTGQEIQYHRL